VREKKLSHRGASTSPYSTHRASLLLFPVIRGHAVVLKEAQKEQQPPSEGAAVQIR
jgi:hypothetical protein